MTDSDHPGHSVLQVPVQGLERFVRSRHAHYDPAYVSADPAFIHAHITALGPWLDQTAIDAEALALVANVAASIDPFDYALDRLETFPNGIIHLRPEPEDPFRELTQRLVEAFPKCPPYGGRYDVAPHLTLDLRSDLITEESTRAALGTHVRVGRAERLDLAWYEPHGCGLLDSWPLG
jgi:2'-5' RNA ligase